MDASYLSPNVNTASRPYSFALPIRHTLTLACTNHTTGSEYKVDASYLSPNVNMASRLEAATKQYGVPLLLSRDFVDCLSPAVRTRVSVLLVVAGLNKFVMAADLSKPCCCCC